MINIRAELSADIEAIRQVHCSAFGQASEAGLVDALRDGGYVRVSLVAEVEGRVVGHILFSEVSIVSPRSVEPVSKPIGVPLSACQTVQDRGRGTGSQLRVAPATHISKPVLVAALALAPLAVVPAWQHRGIGSRLTRAGLDACQAAGHKIVIVLGHPHFYPRFGFSPELARPLESPYSGDAWMAAELAPGGLAGVAGKVEYSPPFGQLS